MPSGNATSQWTQYCFTLQFYQQLAYSDIDEQYLWEQRLQPQLGYLSEEHRTKVREALSLGYDAHIQQKRKSGEPFITHPVEVTRILAELQMDYESLIAGELSQASLCVTTLADAPVLAPPAPPCAAPATPSRQAHVQVPISPTHALNLPFSTCVVPFPAWCDKLGAIDGHQSNHMLLLMEAGRMLYLR